MGGLWSAAPGVAIKAENAPFYGFFQLGAFQRGVA
jgi:hypothetical protein